MSDSLLGTENSGTPPVDDSGAGAPPVDGGAEFNGPEWAKGFEGLDSELLGDPSLKAIQDVPSLIKSYVHAQKKMGMDKAVLPNKNSTKEEWLGLYHKLGLPAEFGEYEFKSPEETVFKDEMLEAFKETAYNNNLLPDQASAVLDFLNNYTSEEASKMQATQEEQTQAAIGDLKNEWGDAFEQNLRKAKLAVQEFGGDELRNYLDQTGLGNDPQIVKVFSQIGDSFFKEDSFGTEGKSSYAMAPDEAQAQINKIMGDFDGPYFNSQHPDHNRIVNEVNKLYKAIYRK